MKGTVLLNPETPPWNNFETRGSLVCQRVDWCAGSEGRCVIQDFADLFGELQTRLSLNIEEQYDIGHTETFSAHTRSLLAMP